MTVRSILIRIKHAILGKPMTYEEHRGAMDSEIARSRSMDPRVEAQQGARAAVSAAPFF